ncbi:MAG: glycosyltransferase family 4 protein [Rhizobiaceae bacterium]
MKVLVYNWVQFDVAGEGGGVSTYLRQTLPVLAEIPGWKVTFLSSGGVYDGFNRTCRYRPTSNRLKHRGVLSFEIVNSPIKAPAHDSVSIIGECLDNRASADTFLRMMEETGPYDAVILHNVEGISTLTLELIKQRTQAALVLFLHNYHLVCPQIELLRDFRDHCHDNHGGRDCVGCFGHLIDTRRAKMARAVINVMDRTRISGTGLEGVVRSTVGHGFGWASDMAGAVRDVLRNRKTSGGPKLPRWQRSMENLDDSILELADRSRDFRRWREENVARVNACADAVITVSNRQRAQLIARGLDSALMKTIHLGFDFHVDQAVREKRYEQKMRKDGPLRLGFFGYAIPSKGLAMLVEALEDAGLWARQVELWIVCRQDDQIMRRLARLSDRLAAVRWIDGYAQDELPAIVREIDVGIIPSIWFETYSITAYELTMSGVPVIMSDSVGFEELVAKPDFRFRRNDKASLRETLERLVRNRELIGHYWDGIDRIPSLDDHMRELLATLNAAVAMPVPSEERLESR